MNATAHRALAATGAAGILLGGVVLLNSTAGAQSTPNFAVTPGTAQVGDVVTFDSACASTPVPDGDSIATLVIDGSLGAESPHLEFSVTNGGPVSGTAVVPQGWLPGGTFSAECVVEYVPGPGSPYTPQIVIYSLDPATLVVTAAPVTTTTTTPAPATTAPAAAANADAIAVTPSFTG